MHSEVVHLLLNISVRRNRKVNPLQFKVTHALRHSIWLDISSGFFKSTRYLDNMTVHWGRSDPISRSSESTAAVYRGLRLELEPPVLAHVRTSIDSRTSSSVSITDFSGGKTPQLSLRNLIEPFRVANIACPASLVPPREEFPL